MTTAEWAKKMEERDVSNIGLSNGYTWVAALAKKNKKKDIDEFMQIMIKEIGDQIKAIDKTTYPQTYKESYKLALSISRLEMLQDLLRRRTGGEEK